jgi:hypothetical protein
MSDLMPGPPLIIVETERSIAALDPDGLPENAALVTLARMYALVIAESGGTQNCLKEIGPKLTATLVALKRARPAPAAGVPVVAAEPEAPTEIEVARSDPGSSASVLDMERARAERVRRAGRPA